MLVVKSARKWWILFGTYEKTIDSKNRVIIPSKFRKVLGSVCYASLGPDNALEIRGEKSFSSWSEKMLANNMLNKNARAFARIILGNTAKLEPDSQGRVLLPANLLKKVTITNEVIFVGVGNKIELWSASKYENFQKQFEGEDDVETLAKKLLDDGAEY